MVQSLLTEAAGRDLVTAIFNKSRPRVVPPSTGAEIGAVLQSRRGIEGEEHVFDYETGARIIDDLIDAVNEDTTLPQVRIEYFPPTERGDPEHFVLAPTTYEQGEICARIMIGLDQGQRVVRSLTYTATPYLARKPMEGAPIDLAGALYRRTARRQGVGSPGPRIA